MYITTVVCQLLLTLVTSIAILKCDCLLLCENVSVNIQIKLLLFIFFNAVALITFYNIGLKEYLVIIRYTWCII